MNENTQELSDYPEPEGSLVFFGRQEPLVLRTYPQEGVEPHFLIMDYEVPDTTKKSAISLLEPRYVNIPLGDNEQSWILNEAEKLNLYKLLKSNRRGWQSTPEKMSIWKAILWLYNHENHFSPDLLPMDLPMPDYLQLPEN